jgi:hypothetical protein
VEPVLALRTALLQLCHDSDLLTRHIRSIAAFARESNRPIVGATALRHALAHPTIPPVKKLGFLLDDAQLSAHNGQTEKAVRAAKQLLTRSLDPALKSDDELVRLQPPAIRAIPCVLSTPVCACVCACVCR